MKRIACSRSISTEASPSSRLLNREEGEASVEIEREQAIRFIHDNIEKDAWLEEFFPKQMEVYHNAIEQTKEQLLKQINMI